VEPYYPRPRGGGENFSGTRILSKLFSCGCVAATVGGGLGVAASVAPEYTTTGLGAFFFCRCWDSARPIHIRRRWWADPLTSFAVARKVVAGLI